MSADPRHGRLVDRFEIYNASGSNLLIPYAQARLLYRDLRRVLVTRRPQRRPKEKKS